MKILLLLALLFLCCCSTRPAVSVDCSPAPTVTRGEVMAIAEMYRSHRWTPEKRHRFHGDDAKGIRVDTPDLTYQPQDGWSRGWWKVGREAVGIPYKWGGFDTPESFDRGLTEGRYAGDVYSSLKRRLLDDGVSESAVGVDCSGFVSRCWRLSRSYSTRELAGLCDSLKTYDELRPGDILNKYNVHVLIFVGFVDERHQRLVAYETGAPPHMRVEKHAIDVRFLKEKGYLPYRYRGMREESSAKTSGE